jgi:hypothetical protein
MQNFQNVPRMISVRGDGVGRWTVNSHLTFENHFHKLVFFLPVLGVGRESRALCKLDKCSTTELRPSPYFAKERGTITLFAQEIKHLPHHFVRIHATRLPNL